MRIKELKSSKIKNNRLYICLPYLRFFFFFRRGDNISSFGLFSGSGVRIEKSPSVTLPEGCCCRLFCFFVNIGQASISDLKYGVFFVNQLTVCVLKISFIKRSTIVIPTKNIFVFLHLLKKHEVVLDI